MPKPTRYPRLTSIAVPVQAGSASFSDGVFMMNRFFEFRSITATFGVVVPFAALVWLFAVPQTMSLVSLVALTLVALGAALVAVNTWRNGQATRHIGHVLNDVEAAAASKAPKRV
jgi:hypothetical protein